MSSYHQKYLKYKNKYLELKKSLNFPETSLNQMGGSSFTEMEQLTATPVATETYGYHLRENALELEGGFPGGIANAGKLAESKQSKDLAAAKLKQAEKELAAAKLKQAEKELAAAKLENGNSGATVNPGLPRAQGKAEGHMPITSNSGATVNPGLPRAPGKAEGHMPT